MNLLLLLLLALPFACLAVLSLVAFLGVAAIAGALHVIGTITSALGIAVRKNADPWHGAVGDAHPLDYVEAQHQLVTKRAGAAPIVIPTKVAVLIFYIPLLTIALSPNTVGAVGPKGAAMKSIITPVLDNAGIIGFIVEYMPDYVEAYFDGELLGSFSSKAEAAAELLLHTERGAFAQ